MEIAIRSVEQNDDDEGPAALVVALHSNISSSNEDVPGALKATLSGVSPTSAGTYTYTCSTGCDLDKDTAYHIVLSAPGSPVGSAYNWSNTSSENETLTPAQNGWSLGTGDYKSSSSWHHNSSFQRLKVAAVAEPSLSAASTGDTIATLKAVSYTDGAWWYKRTAGTPADATCRSVAAGTASVSLSSLTEHTDYTYKAYDEVGCDSADEFGSVTFTQTDDELTASKMTWTTARLTLTGNTANWWLKQTSPVDAGATCKSMGTKSAAKLTGLTQSTAYTYKAWKKAGCNSTADELGSDTFTADGAPEYVLQEIIVRIFSKTNSPGDIQVTLHADASGSPATSALYTLSGSNPTNTSVKKVDYAYTCSECYLQPNTTYWLVLAAPNATGNYNRYTWLLTDSDAQTAGPSGSGWTIGDASKHTVTSGSDSECLSGWCAVSSNRTAMFLVSATVNAVGPPREFKASEWRWAGSNIIHELSWKKPASSGTDSFAYEVQCSGHKTPTSTQWNACGTKTVSATPNATVPLGCLPKRDERRVVPRDASTHASTAAG